MINLPEIFLDFFKALNASNTQYLVVGGMAVVLYGVDRTTGDMDIWVDNSPANLASLQNALLSLGYQQSDVEKAIEEYATNGKLTIVLDENFPMELLPMYSSIVRFEDAFANRIVTDFSGVPLNVVDLDTLIDMKIRAGREKDWWDVKMLKEKGA